MMEENTYHIMLSGKKAGYELQYTDWADPGGVLA